MSATWSFSDLEFVSLWERITGEDDLPSPFLFTSRNPDFFDFLREKREVSERLKTNPDRSFERVENAITQQDLIIVVDGVDSSDPEKPERRIRLLALRSGGEGFVVNQAPGESRLYSGGFTVTECDPLRLSDAVVAALPEMAAGKRGDIPLTDEDTTDHEFRHSLVSADMADSVTNRQNRFFSIPTVSSGTIDVRQAHSKFGPRGITAHRLWWRDLQDDGRYLISLAPPEMAMSADSRRAVALINQRVAAVVRAIKDERGVLSSSE